MSLMGSQRFERMVTKQEYACLKQHVIPMCCIFETHIIWDHF